MACLTGKKSLEGVWGSVRWWVRVESQQRQWRDEEGGIEDGGIGESWAVVMDAMQGSGTLGLSVIKGSCCLSTNTHTYTCLLLFVRSVWLLITKLEIPVSPASASPRSDLTASVI